MKYSRVCPVCNKEVISSNMRTFMHPECKTIPEKQPSVEVKQTAEEKSQEGISKLDRSYDLLPCPFCGGVEGDTVCMGYKYPYYRASCWKCGFFISDDRTDKVVHHWNRRASQTQSSEIRELREENELLKSLLSKIRNFTASMIEWEEIEKQIDNALNPK